MSGGVRHMLRSKELHGLIGNPPTPIVCQKGIYPRQSKNINNDAFEKSPGPLCSVNMYYPVQTF